MSVANQADETKYLRTGHLMESGHEMEWVYSTAPEPTEGVKKLKVLPYSLLSVGLGADPGVQADSLQVTLSHPLVVR